MTARLTRWMPLLLAALLGGLIWVLNRAAEAPAQSSTVAPSQPDLIAESARMQRFDAQGRLVTVLTATRVSHQPQDDAMFFEHPRVEQSKPGQPELMLVGEQAKAIHRATEIWFYGAVEMRRAANGASPELLIRTRDMYVDTEKQIARSAAPVTADMGSHHARAVGFVANNHEESLELLSQVSMTYVPKKRNDGTRNSVQP